MSQQHASAPQPVYLFLDEGGNFDFSSEGTRYFTMTSVATRRPFLFETPLHNLRFDVIESGANLEYFHASEDRQSVRDQVFTLLASHLGELQIDSVFVEKRKVWPSLRELSQFYPMMLGALVDLACQREPAAGCSQIIAITDVLPVNKKRNAVEKAIKTTLAARISSHVPYRILHHDSKSCAGLQVSDYINWAMYRLIDRNDERSFNVVRAAVKSHVDVLAHEQEIWY